MSDHVYKTVEVTGSSTDVISDAIRTAVAKAAQTLRNLEWFEVVNIRGIISEGSVEYFQVTLKLGFRLE
jgi:dodecin